MTREISLYVHIPFCLKRCTYCDFNTYVGLLDLRPAYVAALTWEIEMWATRYPDLQATTLYFGGGTPSLLDTEQIAAIITAARKWFDLPVDGEVTLEANPGTLDAQKLAGLLAVGVNRLSLGVQSAQDKELELLGRVHNWQTAVDVVSLARQTGFSNISIDLIFGLPGQSVSSWAATLEHILELAPQHLSLYSLTLEEETPLARAIDAGELPEPDPDRAADMYELASEYLLKAGFWQYEVSNWARGTGDAAEVWALPPSGASEGISPWICTHNLNYWRNRPWLGIGAGAYSWLDGHRWNNYSHPRDYVAVVQAGRHPVDEVESIWPALERGETLMMGLRLAEGVEDNRFRCRFGMGMVALYGSIIADMVGLGLLIWDGKRARLSTKGRLLGNRVFGAFLPE